LKLPRCECMNLDRWSDRVLGFERAVDSGFRTSPTSNHTRVTVSPATKVTKHLTFHLLVVGRGAFLQEIRNNRFNDDGERRNSINKNSNRDEFVVSPMV
jgi:hypothetical protein